MLPPARSPTTSPAFSEAFQNQSSEPSVHQAFCWGWLKVNRKPSMPGRSRQWATICSRSGLSRSKWPRMQNLSGCARTASTACTLTASPSELGGWITAQSTPAEAISASASSTEKVGICRCCALILPFCQRWIWESTISMASSSRHSLPQRDYTMAAQHPTPQEEIVTKILTPPQPAPIMEIARELLPPGTQLTVADPGKPEFYDAAVDAE